MFAQLVQDRVRMNTEIYSFCRQLLVHACMLLAPVLLAHCLTSHLDRRERISTQTKAPTPQQPNKPLFTIPFVSDTLWLLFDAERLLRRLQTGFRGCVVPLSLPGRRLRIALAGEGVRTMFRSSRDYVPVPGLFDALGVFFGLTSCDFAIFDHNHIAAFEDRDSEGHITKHADPSRRIIEHQRRDFAKFLNGESLGHIMDRFFGNFDRELRHQVGESTRLPDLYKFVRDAVFRAEVEALYGEHLFLVCPSFCDDFWAFYDAFPVVSRNLPRWLFPSHYEKRDKLLADLHQWRRRCHSMFDWTNEELLDSDYEPVWGTRYVRRMVQRHEKLGFSDAGISSVMLGYLFVTTANTVPAAAWLILHMFLDRSLTYRLRHELSITESTTSSSLNLTALGSAPLLNSVYREALRLHVAGATGRAAVDTGFGSHQAGPVTMTANWLGGLDSVFWNEGRTIGGVPEHPVDAFWAERFLEYPDDPTSGPLRRPNDLELCDIAEKLSAPKNIHDDSRARLANAGLRGHWFPFGGGAWRCPGETLAKNTILASAFLLLCDFEIDFIDSEDALKVSSIHRHRTLPFGTHAFSRLVPVRIHKRSMEASRDIQRVSPD